MRNFHVPGIWVRVRSTLPTIRHLPNLDGLGQCRRKMLNPRENVSSAVYVTKAETFELACYASPPRDPTDSLHKEMSKKVCPTGCVIPIPPWPTLAAGSSSRNLGHFFGLLRIKQLFRGTFLGKKWQISTFFKTLLLSIFSLYPCNIHCKCERPRRCGLLA